MCKNRGIEGSVKCLKILTGVNAVKANDAASDCLDKTVYQGNVKQQETEPNRKHNTTTHHD